MQEDGLNLTFGPGSNSRTGERLEGGAKKRGAGTGRQVINPFYLRGISKAAIQASAYGYPLDWFAGTSGQELRLRGFKDLPSRVLSPKIKESAVRGFTLSCLFARHTIPKALHHQSTSPQHPQMSACS